MANLAKCRDCEHEVSKSAKTCPNCGVAKPAQQQTSTLTGLIAIGLIVWAGSALVDGGTPETPEQRQQRVVAEDREAEEDKRKGFHCLSAWDGSHRAVVSYVEQNLKDPDSFDHAETRITPVNENGEHLLVMQYRAKNGFGALTIGNATATIKNSDCSATITSAE